MSGQSKAKIFGASSVHKSSTKKHRSKASKALTMDEFISMEHVKAYAAENPGAIEKCADGNIYVCNDLAVEYLRMVGNKRLEKELKRQVVA